MFTQCRDFYEVWWKLHPVCIYLFSVYKTFSSVSISIQCVDVYAVHIFLSSAYNFSNVQIFIQCRYFYPLRSFFSNVVAFIQCVDFYIDKSSAQIFIQCRDYYPVRRSWLRVETLFTAQIFIWWNPVRWFLSSVETLIRCVHLYSV